MTYPDFYQAWHTQPTNSPIPDRNHQQNTDIPTLLKQLQPTDKTFPVPLNIPALEGETDTSAIAPEFCTQLYQAIFPADTELDWRDWFVIQGPDTPPCPSVTT